MPDTPGVVERVEIAHKQGGAFSFAATEPAFKDPSFVRDFIEQFEASIGWAPKDHRILGIEDRGKVLKVK
jgi:hypothetical protein